MLLLRTVLVVTTTGRYLADVFADERQDQGHRHRSRQEGRRGRQRQGQVHPAGRDRPPHPPRHAVHGHLFPGRLRDRHDRRGLRRRDHRGRLRPAEEGRVPDRGPRAPEGDRRQGLHRLLPAPGGDGPPAGGDRRGQEGLPGVRHPELQDLHGLRLPGRRRSHDQAARGNQKARRARPGPRRELLHDPAHERGPGAREEARPLLPRRHPAEHRRGGGRPPRGQDGGDDRHRGSTSCTSPPRRAWGRSRRRATAGSRCTRRPARSTFCSTTAATRSRAGTGPSTSCARRSGPPRATRPSGRACATATCRWSATDHCPFDFKGKKDMFGKDDYKKIPNGAPGIETLLMLLHTEGVVKGRHQPRAHGRRALHRHRAHVRHAGQGRGRRRARTPTSWSSTRNRSSRSPRRSCT